MHNRRWMVLVVAAAATMIGCQHSQDGGHTESMRASRSDFERSKDPPVNAETHFAAGQLAESQGDAPNAVKQYKEALKLEPKNRKTLYRLGVVYAQLKMYPEAIKDWQDYEKATDGDANGWSNLGFCYDLAGQYDAAEAAYRAGVAKDPKNNPCRVNYGLMLARHGHLPEALLQLQAVLSPGEAHYNIASVLEAQGRKEQAKAEYKKALEMNPSLIDAQTRLSKIE